MNSLVKPLKTGKIVNTSGLVPVAHAVLVEPIQTALYSKIIEMPETVTARSMMVETVCRVIAVGSECWLKESQPRAAVGDKVMISQWTGHLVVGPKDKKQYRLINQDDIYAKIEENFDVR